jgi:Family of unknown function (DUF5906)
MKLFSPKVDAVCYRPGDPQGIVNITGRRCINTHRPTAIVAVKGSAWPFFRFMRHLIPDQIDRRHVLRWIATLVVRTDIHMSVIILLLISTTQGVGKTTLILDILRPLVGPWNTSCPTEKEIVGSDFDEWKAHKRLACVNEIYSGKSRKMYDALKEMTDATTRINRKYLPRYEVENYLHVAACSNSEAALHLGDEDRRTLVPRVTDKIKPKEYWTEFHDWLRSGGLERIRYALERLANRKGFVIERGERAPMTSMKREIIEASRSPGQLLAHDLGRKAIEMEDDRGRPVKVILAVDEVRRWVAERRGINDVNNDKLERAQTIRKALVAAGLEEPAPGPEGETQRYLVNIDGTVSRNERRKTYVVANFPIAAGAKWEDLKVDFKSPTDVWGF